MKKFKIGILEVQPSQMYINKEKLNVVNKIEKTDVIPVKKIGEKLFFTDGHTRVLSYYLRGIEEIEVYIDEDNMDWRLYSLHVKNCEDNNIKNISDLKNRIISDEEYKVKWIRFCDDLEKRVKNNPLYNIKIEENNDNLIMLLKKELEKHNYSLSVAESCTGGLISSYIVSVSGISQFFKEGIIVYSNESKIKRLNVKTNTIKVFGAVSSETVKEMLEGLNTDTAIAVSGIAGPEGGTIDKPVGTIVIGIKVENHYEINEYLFEGDRNKIRNKASLKAISELIKYIKKHNI